MGGGVVNESMDFLPSSHIVVAMTQTWLALFSPLGEKYVMKYQGVADSLNDFTERREI